MATRTKVSCVAMSAYDTDSISEAFLWKDVNECRSPCTTSPPAPRRETTEQLDDANDDSQYRAIAIALPSSPKNQSNLFHGAKSKLLDGVQADVVESLQQDGSLPKRHRVPNGGSKESDSTKDTMLLRLGKEKSQLESILRTMQSDLKLCRGRLKQARQQIQIQTAYSTALRARIRILEARLAHSPRKLYERIETLSKELADAQAFEQTRARSEVDGFDCARDRIGSRNPHVVETTLLHEQIARQQLEIRKWKQEALGRGREAVSLNWQASVDKAVRREREQDATVIGCLLNEIKRLRVADKTST